MARVLAFARMAAANTSDSATTAGQAAQAQSSQALLVQSYSLNLLQQQPMALTSFDKLNPIITDFNTAIGTAQSHAKSFLDVLLPNCITTISNINAYFNLQNALPQALTPSTDAATAIQLLKAVQTQVQTYQTQSSGLATDLGTLRTNLSADAGSFSSIAGQLNNAVSGDNGVLASISSQLGSVDSKIDGAIAGTVLSGLAIAGGVFLICVGAIADFVTAGTSTPVIVLGAGIVAAGVGGEVASAVTLANLIKLKGSLLDQQSTLNSEVNAALGIQTTAQNLSNAASAAATAAQQMASAWNLLGSDLGNLASQIQSGQTTVDGVRLLYQTAAQGTVKTVQGDIQTIRQQLSGTQQAQSQAGETLADTVQRVAGAAA